MRPLNRERAPGSAPVYVFPMGVVFNSPVCCATAMASGQLALLDWLSLNGRHWIKALEFDSGVGGGEAPICSELFVVAVALPGRDLFVHLRSTVEPTVDALTAQDAQFHLRHVEPAAVAGSMDQVDFLAQSVCRGGIEGGIEAGDVVRVEVVADQRDEFRLGIIFVNQVFNFLRPIDPHAAFAAGHAPPTLDRIEKQEERANANPLVVVIFPTGLAR